MIPGAAAQVSGQAFNNLLPTGSGIIFEQAVSGHDHARSAEAALDGRQVDKGLLDGVEFSFFGQSFDGQDRPSPDLAHGNQTGIYGPPVQKDRTGPAFSYPAAFLDPEQAEVFPQHGQ